MKKIDASKSLIFSRDVEDLKKSLEYLNQDGYFSNSKDFSEYKEATLDMVHVANFVFSPYTFMYDGDSHVFIYFIPKSKAVFVEEEKKKTYRPYKGIDEFCDETGCEVVGEDVITIKNKNTQKEYTLLYVGYSNEEVQLGGYILTFADLLKNYEYALNNFEWLPFGVEE